MITKMQGREQVLGRTNGTGRNGHFPSQTGAVLPPQCSCSGSVLTVMVEGLVRLAVLSHVPPPHKNPLPALSLCRLPHPGTFIQWSVSSSLPRMQLYTLHGIYALSQAALGSSLHLRPPRNKGTERAGGVEVPSSLPSSAHNEMLSTHCPVLGREGCKELCLCKPPWTSKTINANRLYQSESSQKGMAHSSV